MTSLGPVFPGRFSCLGEELLVEVGIVGKTKQIGDGLRGKLRVFQQKPCPANAQGQQILMNGKTGETLEFPGEMVLASVAEGGDLIQGKLFFQVVFQVMAEVADVFRHVRLLGVFFLNHREQERLQQAGTNQHGGGRNLLIGVEKLF